MAENKNIDLRLKQYIENIEHLESEKKEKRNKEGKGKKDQLTTLRH